MKNSKEPQEPTLDVGKFQTEFIEKKPSEGMDVEKKNTFLQNFYNTDIAGSENPELCREQAIALCDAMSKNGMTNFAKLREKFSPGIQMSSQLFLIKEAMESIFYVMHQHPSRSFEDLKNEYADREFLCNEGTFTNLQMVLTDLVLGEAGLGTLVTAVKREWVEQTIKEQLDQGTMGEATAHGGGNIHNIYGYLNLIAKNYNLLPKTMEEDSYVLPPSKEDAKLFLEDFSKRVQDPNLADHLLDMMTDKILGMLPEYTEERYPKKDKEGRINGAFDKAIRESIERYGLPINPAMLIQREDGYPIGLKPQAAELIKHALLLKLKEQGLVTHPDSEYSKFLLETLEPAMDVWDDDYIILLKTGVCDEDTWNVIQESSYKERAMDYMLKSKIVLSPDFRKQILDNPPEDIPLFLAKYGLIHKDKELFEKSKSLELDEGSKAVLWDLARQNDNVEAETYFWEQHTIKPGDIGKRLRWAITTGNEKLFNEIMSDPNLNLSSKEVEMCFFSAAESNRNAMLQTIVSREEWKDIIFKHNSEDERHIDDTIVISALRVSALRGQADVLETILTTAKDVNNALDRRARDTIRKVLETLFEEQKYEIATKLLDRSNAVGLNPTSDRTVTSLFYRAVTENNRKLLQGILQSSFRDQITPNGTRRANLGGAVVEAITNKNQIMALDILKSDQLQRIPNDAFFSYQKIFFLACQEGASEVVEYLLSQERTKELPFNTGEYNIVNSFQAALSNGHHKVVKAFLQSSYAKSIINACPLDKEDIVKAAQMGHIALLESFFSDEFAGVVSPDKSTVEKVLEIALTQNQPKAVQAILSSPLGKEILKDPAKAQNIFLKAAEFNCTSALINLLRKNDLMDPKVLEKSLALLTQNSNATAIRAILSSNYADNISVEGEHGLSFLLKWAVMRKDVDLVDTILSLKNAPEIPIDGEHGLKAILDEARGDNSVMDKLVDFCLANGKEAILGETLVYTAENGIESITQNILDNGAFLTNEHTQKALFEAANNSHTNIVLLIFKAYYENEEHIMSRETLARLFGIVSNIQIDTRKDVTKALHDTYLLPLLKNNNPEQYKDMVRLIEEELKGNTSREEILDYFAHQAVASVENLEIPERIDKLNNYLEFFRNELQVKDAAAPTHTAFHKIILKASPETLARIIDERQKPDAEEPTIDIDKLFDGASLEVLQKGIEVIKAYNERKPSTMLQSIKDFFNIIANALRNLNNSIEGIGAEELKAAKEEITKLSAAKAEKTVQKVQEEARKERSDTHGTTRRGPGTVLSNPNAAAIDEELGRGSSRG